MLISSASPDETRKATCRDVGQDAVRAGIHQQVGDVTPCQSSRQETAFRQGRHFPVRRITAGEGWMDRDVWGRSATIGNRTGPGCADLERYVSAGVDGLVHLMDNDSLPILQRITMLIDAVSDRVKATGGREGCMIGNLSIEVAGASEPLRVQLSDAFSRWCAPLAGALERAQARGEIALTVKPATMANFIQNGLQGALLRAKVDRTSAPIEPFKVILLDLLSQRQAEAKRTSAQRP